MKIYLLACLFALSMENPCLLIRKIPVQHKKPRPHEAKKIYPESYCLLNICPDKQGEVARPVLRALWEGKWTWREFDIIQRFQTEEEAIAYAEANRVTINLTRRVTGTAQNAKQGAVLLTEERQTFYLADKESWGDAEVGKTFTIEGFLRAVYEEERTLMDKDGNYRSGAAGKQNFLDEWRIIQ